MAAIKLASTSPNPYVRLLALVSIYKVYIFLNLKVCTIQGKDLLDLVEIREKGLEIFTKLIEDNHYIVFGAAVFLLLKVFYLLFIARSFQIISN